MRRDPSSTTYLLLRGDDASDRLLTRSPFFPLLQQAFLPLALPYLHEVVLPLAPRLICVDGCLVRLLADLSASSRSERHDDDDDEDEDEGEGAEKEQKEKQNGKRKEKRGKEKEKKKKRDFLKP